MSKTPPLVCQHVENISREALQRYQEIVRQYVRHRQGIYALHRKGKLYYVGLAKDLYWRLKQHLKDHHGESWDRFSMYLTIGDKHLKELETLILRVVKPAGNKVTGKFRKSENLRRRLAADIKAVQREELNGIIGRFVITATTKPLAPNGKIPVLQPYIAGPMRLRGTYKGRVYKALVRRDGSIRVRGKVFTSPSLSAMFVRKTPSCDGWYFWKYERAPGDWVLLNELRK